MAQRSLPAVWMRGGTSKGLFVRESDLPPPGARRDGLLLELMGSPDPMQIDGVGGGVSSTSKVMAVSSSQRPGCDLDYLFAQVAIDRPLVDYRGNCGNLTSAVGAYAIDEGIVTRLVEPITTVLMHNTNTGVRVRARIPVMDGRAAVSGDHHIPGVPTPGARIETEYLEPAGAVFGTLFPTGRPRDEVVVDGQTFEVSIVDVTNPVAFISADALGLAGTELPDALNADTELLERLERVRATCAVRLGLVENPGDAAESSPLLPFLSIVRAPTSYRTALGVELGRADMDVCARSLSLQRVHHACQMTALMCLTAAAQLPGTVVHEVADQGGAGTVRVGHPKGVAAATADVRLGDGAARVETVGVTRTARRLMAGQAYYRSAIGDPDQPRA